jgi:RHS repeat-associated protein
MYDASSYAYDGALPHAYKFTGKERDTESGLDYFGARYYSSTFSRFVTPDWASKPTAVPYAHFGNPQSLNLYSYVQNNPATLGDPDGHCDLCWMLANWAISGVAEQGPKQFSKNVGIGLAKGAGQAGLGIIGGLADKAVPGAGVNLALSKPGMKAIEAVTPSNHTQAEVAPVGAAIATTAVTMGIGAGIGALEGAGVATETEVLTEGTIFRSGGTNPANLTGEGLSFRDTLSNPIGSGENPVFEPGDKYFGADVSKLPEGSAVLDNNPPGHVTVNAAAE